MSMSIFKQGFKKMIKKYTFNTKLQDKIENLENKIKAYEDGIKEIESYLSLPKFFRPNNNVNTSDMFLRLNEIKNEINYIE